VDRVVPHWAAHRDESPRPAVGWRQRRRDRILNAASALFAERPYALVSMDELAEAAEMGKATLYRYFPSKEDLYVAVFELVIDRLAQQLEAAAAQGGGPTVVLTRMIAALTPALGEHFRGLRAIDDGIVQVAERKRRLFRSRRHLITSVLEEVILAGVESGEFRPVRAAACANMIVGMIWTCSVTMSEPEEVIGRTVADLFFNGTLAAPRV